MGPKLTRGQQGSVGSGLSRLPRPGSPSLAPAEWRTFVDIVGGGFGVLSLTLQAPPELLSLLTAGGGENPSLAVCFAGPCASPSVSGLICRSSKFLAESCYLCTFPYLWLLLKKKVEAPFARHWGEILRAFPQRLCHLHGVSHVALDPEPPSQSQREAAALPGLSPSLSSKV